MLQECEKAFASAGDLSVEGTLVNGWRAPFRMLHPTRSYLLGQGSQGTVYRIFPSDLSGSFVLKLYSSPDVMMEDLVRLSAMKELLAEFPDRDLSVVSSKFYSGQVMKISDVRGLDFISFLKHQRSEGRPIDRWISFYRDKTAHWIHAFRNKYPEANVVFDSDMEFPELHWALISIHHPIFGMIYFCLKPQNMILSRDARLTVVDPF